METFDYLVVGGGIAGASIGYQLAASGGKVAITEMESMPGYHTTGRSAAFYAETYGGALFRPLTTASKAFLHQPPAGFSEVPLITPRGVLYIFGQERQAAAESHCREMQADLPGVTLLNRAGALAVNPSLTPDFIAGAIADPDCGDLDVAALHQGYLRGFKARGGQLMTGFELARADRRDGLWRVKGRAGQAAKARTLINTAGAWADGVAEAAGLAPIGMQPLRRTIAVVTVDETDVAHSSLPLTVDLDDRFYFRPEGDGFLLSPADETLSPPCDAQPEAEDVAWAVHWFEQATGRKVLRVDSRWAGLRTFSCDRGPVIGFDPRTEGFFWSVGQGGYGIQTADGWSRMAAALVTDNPLDADLTALGVRPEPYAPDRFF